MPVSRSKERFADLLLQNQHRIVGCIFSLVHKMHDTEEIFQQVCLTMWEKFETFELGSDFGGWACSIARWKVKSFLQKERVHRAAFGDDFLEDWAVWEAAQSDEADDRVVAALRGCMDRLQPRDRELLEVRYGGGEMVAAMAGRLGRTPQSISNSLGRIRSRLLQCVRRTLAMEGC